MKQMTLPLDELQQRPVVRLNRLRALLDTGAYIPIWFDDEEILTSVMGGTLIRRDVEFSGFGGTTKGNLYRVTMYVGDLIYPNMAIIANSELDVPFNLIISATMFQNLLYEVDDKNHRLNITVPDDESNVRNLCIADKDGKIHVLCNSVWENDDTGEK